MDVHLTSALCKHKREQVPPERIRMALLLYQERGFVNSTMELLRDAADRVSENTSLVCAIWDFNFVVEPLLKNAAAKEACAAHMIIVALRSGDELPARVRDWLQLWLVIHPVELGSSGDPSFQTRHLDSHRARAAFQFQNVGKLADINLFTLGGATEPTLNAFRDELSLVLAFRTNRPPGSVTRGFLTGQVTREEELWRDSRATCSGYHERFVCYEV